METLTTLAPVALTVAAKAAAVLTIGLVALVGLRRQRASVRHAVAAATLACALAIPGLSRSLPIWRAPLPDIAMPVMSEAPAQIPTSAGPNAVLASVTGNSLAVTPRASATQRADVALAAVLLLWAVGGVAVLTRLLVGFVSTRRLIGSTQRADAEWQHASKRVGEKLALRGDVVVLRHSTLAVPITAGAFRPVIIIPDSASGWSAERRDLVLAHELAHVDRRDCLVDYIAWVACAAYWFLPMTWRLAARIRVDRERACDDVVLGLGTPAPDYADHLVDLATDARAARAMAWQAAALAMAPVGTLESRVRDILAPQRKRGSMTRLMHAGVLSGAAAVVVPLSALALHESTALDVAVSAVKRDTLDIPLGVDETVRWTGAIARGATISVRANMGNIRIDSAEGPDIEVVAQRRAGPYSQPSDTRLSIVRGADGLAVCSVYVDPVRGRSTCDVDGAWGRTSIENNEVSLRLRVPPGIHMRIQAGNGHVIATGIRGDVYALDGNGGVFVQNDGAADLTAYTGPIEFKRLSGGAGGPIALHVLHGGITARLPYGVAVDAIADTGVVRISAPGLANTVYTSRYRGALLDARTPLTARIQKGDIDIAVSPP